MNERSTGEAMEDRSIAALTEEPKDLEAKYLNAIEVTLNEGEPTTKLIFEDRTNVNELFTFFKCINILECGAVLSVTSKQLPDTLKCPICHKMMYVF